MGLSINDTAPDFEADTTEGRIGFHDWIGDSWAVLFSQSWRAPWVTAEHRVATPVNWKQGEDVIIAGSVSNDEAKQTFGDWKQPKPYIRIVPQPQ